MTQGSLSKLDKTLTTKNWEKANLSLLAKIFSELMYEDILVTDIVKLNTKKYNHTLHLGDGFSYTFTAEPRIFGTWRVDKSSIKFYINSALQHKISVSDFMFYANKIIGITELNLGHFLRELNHTLIADCHLSIFTKNTNDDLIALDSSSKMEGFMHGHPWFVINKGRLGFSYSEYLNYAPEMRNLQQLSWIAVSRDNASFNAIDELDYLKLIRAELSASDLDKFNLVLEDKQLGINDYFYMPIHEWQWQRQIIQLFPEDIVTGQIIYLGIASDNYLATQSIRSFSNQSDINKYQVKLPISIFNTAVYRGLPNEKTLLAPLLSQWIKTIVAGDKFLNTESRLIMLGEVASINYSHKDYSKFTGVPYQYQELLGVIWRENVNNYISADERVITMASLIHCDSNGAPFIDALILKSGLTTSTWLEQLFAVCIPPLLHWLYKYGMVFSAHGENTMLIIKDYCPIGFVLKDFIDDASVTDGEIIEAANLPPELLNNLNRLPAAGLTQFIHTGLFVVLYRYLSDILETHCSYPETVFWQQVQDVIVAYHNAHPEFEEQIAKFDLLKSEFPKMRLNHLRMISVGYKDYAERPTVNVVGVVNNPINVEYLEKYKCEQDHSKAIG